MKLNNATPEYLEKAERVIAAARAWRALSFGSHGAMAWEKCRQELRDAIDALDEPRWTVDGNFLHRDGAYCSVSGDPYMLREIAAALNASPGYSGAGGDEVGVKLRGNQSKRGAS